MTRKFTSLTLLLIIFALGTPFLRAGNPEINLFGHLIYSQQSGTDYGIYQFTTTENTLLSHQVSLAVEPNAGAVKAGDYYYLFNIANPGTYDATYSVYIYDTTQDYALVTQTKTSSSFMTLSQVLAYDPTTQKIYCTYSDAYSGNTLAVLNLSNRTRETVASLGYTKFLALSFDSQGRLYGISNIGILYEINKANGELRYIGATGVSPAEYQQAMTFSQDDDKTLYWAATLAAEGALYAVDVTTGKASEIKKFPQEEQFASLWAGRAVVQGAAPSKATNLAVSFPNGSLSGTLSFDAPTETHHGTPLSGSLTYKVRLDGKPYTSGQTQAGMHVECSITTTQGLHDFAVVLGNEAGDGEETTLTKIYIGHDVPQFAREVKLAKGENHQELTLTWQAPSKGVHDGYFDPNSVKYIVRRMPEGVQVSDNAKSPFKEVVSSPKPIRIFYDVTPYIDEATKGVAISSNKVMIGDPYTIPYTEDFSTNDNVLSFLIEDTNSDGKTWEYMYDEGYMRIYNNDTPKDDWLFTPYIALEKEKAYKLSFDVRSLSAEKLEVKLGDDATSSAMTTTLIEAFAIDDYNWKTIECTFSVSDTKAFFIGFHAMSQDVATALALYIDNLRVEEMAPVAPKKKPLHFAVASDSQGLGTLSAMWKDPAESFGNGTEVASGEKITFTAKPNPGYKVDKWTLNGATLPAEEFSSPTTYNYTTTGEETTIQVHFAKQAFVVQFASTGNGVIEAFVNEKAITSGEEVPYLEKVTFIAKPSENYVLKAWYKNGTLVNHLADIYQLTITEPTTIEAAFDMPKSTVSIGDQRVELQLIDDYLCISNVPSDTEVSVFNASGELLLRSSVNAPIDLRAIPLGTLIVRVGTLAYKLVR